jgi:hypothetical protein
MAIGFVDLVNSTEWATNLALRDQVDALAAFEKAAWEIATRREVVTRRLCRSSWLNGSVIDTPVRARGNGSVAKAVVAN